MSKKDWRLLQAYLATGYKPEELPIVKLEKKRAAYRRSRGPKEDTTDRLSLYMRHFRRYGYGTYGRGYAAMKAGLIPKINLEEPEAPVGNQVIHSAGTAGNHSPAGTISCTAGMSAGSPTACRWPGRNTRR